MKRKRMGLLLAVVAGLMLSSASALAQPKGGPYDPGCPMPDYCCEQGVPNIPVGQKCMILHQIGDGENLHMLAAYYYGDARAWRVIYQYNRNLISNPNVIRAGQIVQVYVEPCWAPRYDFEEFKSLELKRREELDLLKGEKGVKARTMQMQKQLEMKEIKIEAKPEETTPPGGAKPAPAPGTVTSPPPSEEAPEPTESAPPAPTPPAETESSP